MRCSWTFGGASIPLTNMASDYGIGFNVIADVSYMITKQISLILMAGYNYFHAKNSGGDDTSIVNIALNARYNISVVGDLSAYIGAGPDIYIQDFKDLLFGYNAGLGLDYELSPRICAG